MADEVVQWEEYSWGPEFKFLASDVKMWKARHRCCNSSIGGQSDWPWDLTGQQFRQNCELPVEGQTLFQGNDGTSNREGNRCLALDFACKLICKLIYTDACMHMCVCVRTRELSLTHTFQITNFGVWFMLREHKNCQNNLYFGSITRLKNYP